MNTPKYPNKKAFTLIELLVVIAIIGLLSTISIIALNQARAKARDSKRLADIRQIRTALEVYFDKNGHYPTYATLSTRCNTTLDNSLSPLISEGLMSSIPTDPKNTPTSAPRFCYEYIGDTGDISSSWYCSGHMRTEYEWAIMFSVEETSFNLPRLTNSLGQPTSDYTYCVTGDLK